MRTVAVVTVARSDYGIYLPILKRMVADPSLQLQLVVAGAHLSPEFGLTFRAIEADGFEIAERVEMLVSSDTPTGTAMSMGLGTIGFAHGYARLNPDLLLVLGDRFEMHAAVQAALPFGIPVAHIHGGETTAGAIDDSFRHSITKMSHLHFVATDAYAHRVIRMGEDPWRVVVSGAPSLDNLRQVRLLDRGELAADIGIDLSSPLLLVTYHPVTLEYGRAQAQFHDLLAALDHVNGSVVITYPNADAESRTIIAIARDYVSRRPRARLLANLGLQRYFSMMRYADAMVGNSSSGIIEAASFELPVVNIGNRQMGRISGRNVIDVGASYADIVSGIEQALQPRFRASLSGIANPYGDGHAAETIVESLSQVELGETLLSKRFHEPHEDQAIGE